jgi:hydroxymethylpyrimidine pyrophosphatase-like HAD family hydrolase
MASIYCDIDGTLTIPPEGYKYDGSAMGKWREPNLKNIAKIKELIEQGHEVVIWTGGGRKYAKQFCRKYDIRPLAILAKPKILIDDNPNVRPLSTFRMIDPRKLLECQL